MASLALVFDLLARDNASATFRNVGNEAERAGKKTSTFGSVTSKAMGVAAGAIAGIGIGALVTQTVRLASSAEQSLGGVQAVFKGYADTVTATSARADKAVGLSANSYRELATVIGSQLKNAGVPMDELAAKTDGLVAMGADLAAMFGGTTQEAVQALSSALKGEMDPIERYGISLNDAALKAEAAALGLEVLGGNLTNSQKVMAVMSLVTKQGADAVGAFGRESDTAAGRAARASAQWENLQTAIGEKLLPAFSSLMDFVSKSVIPGLETVGGAIGNVGRFAADNEGLVAALGVALGIHLAGGITAVTVAFNRMILTPVVLGLSNLLGVVLNLPGALRTASAATAGFIAAAAPLAAAGGVIYALTEFISNTSAAEDQLKSATEAGQEFGRVLSAQGGEINRTTREAAELAIEAAGLSEAFEAAGITSQTVTQAVTGNADAFREALDAAKQLDAETSFIGNSWGLLGIQMDIVSGRATQNTDAFLGLAAAGKAVNGAAEVANGNLPLFGTTLQTVGQMATGAATATETAAEDAEDAAEKWLTALEGVVSGFIDPLATYKGLLDEKTQAERDQAQATADATKSGKDSWEDYVRDAKVSLAEYATALDEQNRAQEDWRTNLVTISQRGGAEVAQILASMGVEGAQITAEMATATEEDFQHMKEALITQAGLGGSGAAAALDRELQVMAGNAKDGSKQTVQEIARELGVGVGVVRSIFRQYGIELASGVNPLLRGLGKPGINISSYGLNSGGGRAMGGYIEGPGGPTDDKAGLFALSNGEYVVKAASVAKYGKKFLDDLNIGRLATGGLVGRRKETGAASDYMIFEDGSSRAGMPSGVGIWQQLWNIVKKALPFARLTSAFRGGDPGPHGTGHAIDVAGANPGDAGAMMTINRWIASNFPNSYQLIHTPGINLLNGRPYTYNAATRADHYDHVHWAMQTLSAMGAAGLPAVNLPKPPSTAPFRPPISTPADAAMQKMYDEAQGFVNANSYTGAGGPIPSGPVQEQVRAIAARYGWGSGANWDALVRLVQGESGWNPNAANPTSSARGLFQKMTSLHGPIESTVAGQAQWGLNYILGAYGSPLNAYAKWSSRSPHWYHDGGVVPNLGIADVPAMLAPGETVRTPTQEAALHEPKPITVYAQFGSETIRAQAVRVVEERDARLARDTRSRVGGRR